MAADLAAAGHRLRHVHHPDQAGLLHPDQAGQPAVRHPSAEAEESADLPDAEAAECPAAAVQEDADDSDQKNNKEQYIITIEYCSFYAIPFKSRLQFRLKTSLEAAAGFLPEYPAMPYR